MYIPRHEIEALVNALKHYAFGYDVDAQHAASAWRKLARWIEEDPNDGPYLRVVESVVRRSDGVFTLDREPSASGAPERDRPVAYSAVAVAENTK